ncbi:MAG: lysostaphin resistance A-like protein [Phycisphaerae bacterium]
MEPTSQDLGKYNRLNKAEVLLLAFILTIAFHGILFWLVYRVMGARTLYDRLGPQSFANLWDGLSALMPLLLCLGAPSRSGLRLGTWKSSVWKVLAVCGMAVILTGIIYPLTSKPFTGGHTHSVGMWLISPAAQDLLFTGYLYGLLNMTFPGRIRKSIPINKAVFLTAGFFALWHVPNFMGIKAEYVAFQLTYTFVGGAWVLLARQWTGSVLPGLATHMAVNHVAWKGINFLWWLG